MRLHRDYDVENIGCNLCTKRSTKPNSKQNSHAPPARHKAHAQNVEQKALATHHPGQNEEAFEEPLEGIATLKILETLYKTSDSIISSAVNCNEPLDLKLHSIRERCSIDKSKLNWNVSPTRCKWPSEWITCHVVLDRTNSVNHCKHICQGLHFSCISLRFRYSFYIKHNFLLVHIFYGFYERLLVAVTPNESSTKWNSFSDARVEFLEHGIDFRLLTGKVLFLLLHIRLHCITHEFKQIMSWHPNRRRQLRVTSDRNLRESAAASSQSAVKLTRHKTTVAENLHKISKQAASTGKPQARKQHDLHHRKLVVLKHHLNAIFFIIVMCMPILSSATVHNIKYSTNVVKTKYGPLRGILLRSNPAIEAYLGVPYATPPVGSLRYMPPVTPSTWKSTRLADHFAPVCPQAPPVSTTGREALLEVPRGRLAQIRRLMPLLTNQSEDCLYLNLYVPQKDTAGAPIDKPMATIVYVHGESYEWNSGNPYDGSVLAAHGNIIVVTINFRLGVLGFLKTGTKGSAQGNFGLMDLVAGLHWLRENLPAFNGDAHKVTLMGHGTGAALANILIVSPVASDLVHRAILFSGSALSPWAIQKDPLAVKKKVAEHTGCHGDLLADDIAPCLRTKPLSDLLSIKLNTPRFLAGFAPFIDGTVLANPPAYLSPMLLPSGSAIASTSGLELADVPSRELLLGLTSIESYLDLSAQDLEFGFNETRRDRILRTYVRNVYHFHLNEIFSALKNEYTDWERPPRNQLGSRDAALELLSDGHTVAPLVRLGYLHSLRGGRSYLMHFKHQSGERDFPQRAGTVRGEEVPFCFGLPLSPLFPYNYTQQDIQISRVLIHYLSNFIKTGNPNGPTVAPPGKIDIESLKQESQPSSSTSSAITSSSHHQMPENMSDSVQLNLHMQTDNRRKRFAIEGTIRESLIRNLNKRNSIYFESGKDQPASEEEMEDESVEQSNEDSEEETEAAEREVNNHDRLDYEEEAVEQNQIKMHIPFWDTYDTINQLYIELNNKPEIKNHYRGHKLSMWLSLIPQLHTPGDPTESMRHHHFVEEEPKFYDGPVRPKITERPPVFKQMAPLTTVTPTFKTETTPSPIMQPQTTECPPNSTIVPTIAATRPQQSPESSGNNFLRRLTSNHIQSYATALTVTIAVGCFLLLLNVFIFAAIYYQREKRATYTKKKEELTEAENMNSSSPSIDRYHKGSRKPSLQSVSGAAFGEYSCYEEKLHCKGKQALVDLCTVELPMQEFKCSPPCSSTTSSIRRSITPDHYKHQAQENLILLPPTYVIQQMQDPSGMNNLVTYRSINLPSKEQINQGTQSDSPGVHDVGTNAEDGDREFTSPDVPECPPPPRANYQGGILRQTNAPTTPGTSKKRVQIQEISV